MSINSNYVAAPSLKPDKFYYNFSQIKKSFYVYLNLKHMAALILRLDEFYYNFF